MCMVESLGAHEIVLCDPCRTVISQHNLCYVFIVVTDIDEVFRATSPTIDIGLLLLYMTDFTSSQRVTGTYYQKQGPLDNVF